MPLALSKKTNQPYVLKADRKAPKEKQTTFWLRSITSLQHLQIHNVPDAVSVYAVVKAGLTGWDNLCFDDGAPAKCEREDGPRVVWGVEMDSPVKDDSLTLLCTQDLAELCRAILDLSTLTRADQKN